MEAPGTDYAESDSPSPERPRVIVRAREPADRCRLPRRASRTQKSAALVLQADNAGTLPSIPPAGIFD